VKGNIIIIRKLAVYRPQKGFRNSGDSILNYPTIALRRKDHQDASPELKPNANAQQPIKYTVPGIVQWIPACCPELVDHYTGKTS
jgi:hypothetical protein